MAQPAMEERMAHLEGRVEGFDGRFDAIDRRFDALDAKVDRLREELGGRMERHFQWTMGLMIALWSTVVVAMVVQSA